MYIELVEREDLDISYSKTLVLGVDEVQSSASKWLVNVILKCLRPTIITSVPSVLRSRKML